MKIYKVGLLFVLICKVGEYLDALASADACVTISCVSVLIPELCLRVYVYCTRFTQSTLSVCRETRTQIRH